jgi:hypothetical protein
MLTKEVIEFKNKIDGIQLNMEFMMSFMSEVVIPAVKDPDSVVTAVMLSEELDGAYDIKVDQVTYRANDFGASLIISALYPSNTSIDDITTKYDGFECRLVTLQDKVVITFKFNLLDSPFDMDKTTLHYNQQ